MKRALVAALFAASLTAGTAFAQATTEPAPSDGYAPATQHVDFGEGDTVEGEFARPDGLFIASQGRARMPSLVKVRANFIPEMYRSAEDL